MEKNGELKRFSLIGSIVIAIIALAGIVWASSGRLTRVEEKAKYNEKGIDRNYDEIIKIKLLVIELKGEIKGEK